MAPMIAADARQSVLGILPKGAVGIEIGVWKGNYSAQILNIASPAKLHLVDPWLANEAETHEDAWYGSKSATAESMEDVYKGVTDRFAREIEAGQVDVHRGHATDILAKFAPASVDFVYIDGDHAYEGVRADLSSALRVTRPGGLICCDDYALGSWWKDGVVRAVHEFLAAERVILQMALGSQIVIRKLRPER